jgi:uroporphyrinogen-III synthase
MTATKLLITRPESHGREFAEAVARRYPGRFETLLAPLTGIHPVRAASGDGWDAVIFTSRVAAGEFARRWPQQRGRAYCVGDETAASAGRHGFEALSAVGDVRALERFITTRARPSDRLLYARGTHISADLAANLRRKGFLVTERVIYDQRPQPLTPAIVEVLKSGAALTITLFSARSAWLFKGQVLARDVVTSGFDVLAISQKTLNGLDGLRFRSTRLSDAPSAEAMLRSLGRPA